MSSITLDDFPLSGNGEVWVAPQTGNSASRKGNGGWLARIEALPGWDPLVEGTGEAG